MLARTAGISPSAFSSHYPSVAVCAAHALDEVVSELTATCAAARAKTFPAARGCGERFLAVADAALHWLVRHPAMARMLFVIPEQAHDPVLLGKVAACKHLIAAGFEDPAHYSPAGSTHVEFMVGLFFHAARRHLLTADDPAALRDQVLAMVSFTRTPRLSRPVADTDE